MNSPYIRPLALAIFGVTAAFPQPIPVNPVPSREVGHPQLTVSTVSPNLVEGREMYNPLGIALDTGTSPPILYIADTYNNRVMAWKNATQFSNGAPADLIIGQKDRFTTFSQGPGSSFALGFSSPTGLAVRNRALYVVDSGNNRIMRFPDPFAQTDLFPDLVIGQPNFSTRLPNYTGQVSDKGIALSFGSQTFTSTIAFDNSANGNLYVIDPGNRRLLRFPRLDSASGGGLAADLVIGQFDFSTVDPLPSGANIPLVRDRFYTPNALAFDPQGNLFVSDSIGAAGRVLVFRPPFASNMGATRIMGIISDPLTATQNAKDRTLMLDAEGMFALPGNGGMAIIEAGSSRILLFDPLAQWPSEDTLFSPQARAVVGQTDFNNRNPNGGNAAPGGLTFSSPFAAVMTATDLYLADTGNNRVIVLPFAGGAFSPATRALGQDRMETNSPNLIEGREFAFTAITRTGTQADAGVVVDTVSDPPHLYVADPYNHRILGFNDSRKVRPGDRADIVIGQPDFTTSLCNYPSNNVDRPTQSGLCRPIGLAVDNSGNLYVADSGNARVLRFPTPFARQGVLPQADLVLGQSSFTLKFVDPTPRTMSAPYGLAFVGDSGLVVSDAVHNRVLYFPRSNGEFTNGQSATKVVGQPDFSTITAGSLDNRFNFPRHVATDSDGRLYVADSGNSRTLIFDQILSLPGADAHAGVTLASAQGVRGVYVNPRTGEIWTTGQGGAFRYNRFDQLLLGTAPTLTVQAPTTTLAVSQDQYGNLFSADATSRIGVYFPGLTALNGATLLPKALAPGMIATLKPIGQQFGTETADYTNLPNPLPVPTDLADIQVLVNDVLAPLFYVSPSQINFQVPMGTPAPSQVDITAIKKSTGQILGTSPVTTDVASPAILFTGSGNILQAVVNNADGKPNSTTNPAPIGSVISIFAIGQGVVPNAPADGAPASGETPTPEKPRVFILPCYTDDCEEPDDGITYSGLAPQLVGIWQIDVRIPKKVVPAPQVPVILQYKGRFSQDSGGPRTVIAVKAVQ